MWTLVVDLTVLVHWLWVAGVLLGPLGGWKNSTLRFVHLIMLWITAGVELSGFYCPLTIVETSLRMRYDPTTAYAEGFLQHGLNRLTSWNVDGSTLFWLTLGWTLLWTVLYGFLWRMKAGFFNHDREAR